MPTVFAEEIIPNIRGSVSALTCASECIIFLLDRNLFIYPGCQSASLPSEGDNAFSVEIPFPAATLCSWGNLLFLAASDQLLLAELQHSGGAISSVITNIKFLYSAAPPMGVDVFKLITYSIFSCDGEYVAFTNRNEVVICSIPSSLEMNIIDTNRPNIPSDVTLLCFASTLLFTVSRCNLLLVWEFKSHRDVTLLKDCGILVASTSITAIQADDRNDLLFVGMAEGTIRILSMSRGGKGGVGLMGKLFEISVDSECKRLNLSLILLMNSIISDEQNGGQIFPRDISSAEQQQGVVSKKDGILPAILGFQLLGDIALVCTTVGIFSLGRTNYILDVVKGHATVSSFAATSPTGLAASYHPFSHEIIQIRVLAAAAKAPQQKIGSKLKKDENDDLVAKLLGGGQQGEKNCSVEEEEEEEEETVGYFGGKKDLENQDDNNNNVDLVHACERLSDKICAIVGGVPQSATSPSEGTMKGKSKRGTTTASNKPVTFGRGPIKSSGYSAQVPWSVQKQMQEKAKQKSAAASKKMSSPALFQYDCQSAPPVTELSRSASVLSASKIHTGCINSLAFDAVGNYLVSGSNDGTMHMLKLPCVKYGGEGYCCRGHKLPVLTVDSTLHVNNPIVATGSTDGSFALWRPSKPRELPYIMEPVQAGGREVKCTKFFYMDNFLCVANGSSIQLIKYTLDEGGDDLDRHRNESKWTNPLTISTTAQCVNSFDCFNSFLSNVIVWAGSNKSIGIYDVVKGVNISVLEDAHIRTIHTVEALRTCRYSSPSIDALHLFATSGLDKCVRLWDMRQKQPVRLFSAHCNSSVKVGMCLSPCGRYLTVGSEDRAGYMYDLGTSAVVSKLSMPEVVSAVRYHPTQPILCLGAQDGALRFFSGTKTE